MFQVLAYLFTGRSTGTACRSSEGIYIYMYIYNYLCNCHCNNFNNFHCIGTPNVSNSSKYQVIMILFNCDSIAANPRRNLLLEDILNGFDDSDSDCESISS